SSTAGNLPDQRLVPDAVGLGRLGTEALPPVGLVVGEVAFEPPDLRLALEGQHVGGDPVEEPPVVADDDGAAGEGQQPLLQRSERSVLARCSRLRSPPESLPTGFCWSVPLNPNWPA